MSSFSFPAWASQKMRLVCIFFLLELYMILFGNSRSTYQWYYHPNCSYLTLGKVACNSFWCHKTHKCSASNFYWLSPSSKVPCITLQAKVNSMALTGLLSCLPACRVASYYKKNLSYHYHNTRLPFAGLLVR